MAKKDKATSKAKRKLFAKERSNPYSRFTKKWHAAEKKKAKYKNMSFQQRAKACAKAWGKLTAAQKAKY